jgi:protein required for attachment to host cells
MKRALIATVDATRARLFLYQEQAKPGFELTEYRDLDNPGRRMRANEMFSTSRPDLGHHGGINRASHSTGGARSDSGEPGGGYDDHRFAHIEEMDTKFAKHVVETIQHVLKDKQMGHLILIAPPKMLGALRAVGGLDKEQLALDELDKDLSNLSLAALHDHLATAGLLPERQRFAAGTAR